MAARHATAADVPRLLELAGALRAELRPQRGGAVWAAREAPHPMDAAAFAGLLARADGAVIVGSFDGVVAGYATVTVEVLRDGSRLGVVGDLFVDAGLRGVGVGESIAAEVVAFCAAAGCAGVDAIALPGNRDAKNFFERSGFTARALVMHKRLP